MVTGVVQIASCQNLGLKRVCNALISTSANDLTTILFLIYNERVLIFDLSKQRPYLEVGITEIITNRTENTLVAAQ